MDGAAGTEEAWCVRRKEVGRDRCEERPETLTCGQVRAAKGQPCAKDKDPCGDHQTQRPGTERAQSDTHPLLRSLGPSLTPPPPHILIPTPLLTLSLFPTPFWPQLLSEPHPVCAYDILQPRGRHFTTGYIFSPVMACNGSMSVAREL